MTWTPDSWRSLTAGQQPNYPDAAVLEDVLRRLAKLPPLVTSWEVESLKRQLASASRGERFLLQGGDCSESFAECDAPTIAAKLKILLQMSLVLVYGSKKPVIRVGRFAGQYAKPRSADTETRDGVTLPSYRGDLVNAFPFTDADRRPDPQRLIDGYQRAALTLNFIRALSEGGFADLHHPEYWNLDFVPHSPHADDYQKIVRSIGDAVRFFETVSGGKVGELQRVEFFTSHEALHLPYEEAQTRQVPRREGWYDLSTHLPWIGERTRDLGGAHVEFCRGIENPIGVKVGPSIEPSELIELTERLNPENQPGRLTLIHRMGVRQIASALPPLLDAVRRAERNVLWCCDAMHGNTVATGNGYKTRDFDDILGELEQAFTIHADVGTLLGGVHFELTGDDVTECIGGARGPQEADLPKAYKSEVDPRLNYEQAMEMAFRIASKMGGRMM